MRKRAGGTGRGAHERGQTLAEFGMILPVLILLIFGLIDIARMMESWVSIQEAAREGARYGVTGRIDCTGPASPDREKCIRQTVTNATASLNNKASITTTFKSWDFPAYAEPPAANNAGLQCDALEVDVAYDYQPITPVFRFFFNHVPMQASERMVNEPYGTCS
jgi:Flp pilus assembly protein TadG